MKSAPETLWTFFVASLYGLKEPDVVLKDGGPGKIMDKSVARVVVKSARAPVEVTLSFDQATGLMVLMEYDGHFGHRKGRMSVGIHEYTEVEGIKLPLQSTMNMDDKPIIEETFVSATLGETNVELFKRPAQARFGEARVRQAHEHTVVAAIHKGSYKMIGMTMGKLFGWLGQHEIAPMGPPVMVFVKDPSNTKKEEEYVTEIRIPVNPPANPELVKWEEFTLKTIPLTTMAVRAEQGPYEKVAQNYAPLAGWCREKGYEIVGPALMTSYSNPMTTAPDKLLSEIAFPVKKSAAAGSGEPAG